MKRQELNRRNFIRTTVAGSVFALAGRNLQAQESGTSTRSDAAIIRRKLGNTDIELPVISMGVMRADNPALVKAALKAGVVHLDTAHVYQGGKNEEMLGKVLKDYPRDSYIISSKVKIDGYDRETGNFSPETNPDEVLEKLEISLDRLGLEYVDILYLHAIESYDATLYKPILKKLKKAKSKGLARYIGVSTHRNMAEVIQAAIDHKLYDIVLTAYNFQMRDDEKMNSAIEKAGEAGLGIIGMKTMAGGFFDKERTEKVNAKAALKWVLSNKNIHTTIPGFSSFDEMEVALSVMTDIQLDDQEKEDLKLSNPTASLYCTGCNSCVSTCRHHLNIPDFMRAYMYTYGYHEYEKAQNLLMSQIPQTAEICSDCNDCTVSCPKSFNVAQRLQDVDRLRTVPREFFS